MGGDTRIGTLTAALLLSISGPCLAQARIATTQTRAVSLDVGRADASTMPATRPEEVDVATGIAVAEDEAVAGLTARESVFDDGWLYLAGGPLYPVILDTDFFGKFDGDVGFYLRGGGEFERGRAALRVYSEGAFFEGTSEDLSGLDVSVVSLSANATLLPARGRIKPSLGVGVGYTTEKFTLPVGEFRESGPAVRGNAGLEGYITERLSVGITATYEHAFVEQTLLQEGADSPLRSLLLGINVAYRF